jgi:hypothetical protein
MCGKKICSDNIICSSHNKRQKGGFYELVYPLEQVLELLHLRFIK